MANEAKTFQNYEEFWPFYLGEHAKRGTRQWHIAGTSLAILVILIAFYCLKPLLLLAAPVLGYGVIWTSHAFIEKNKPATFLHPLWSLHGDFRMWWLWLTGGLEIELIRQKIFT